MAKVRALETGIVSPAFTLIHIHNQSSIEFWWYRVRLLAQYIVYFYQRIRRDIIGEINQMWLIVVQRIVRVFCKIIFMNPCRWHHKVIVQYLRKHDNKHV